MPTTTHCSTARDRERIGSHRRRRPPRDHECATGFGRGTQTAGRNCDAAKAPQCPDGHIPASRSPDLFRSQLCQIVANGGGSFSNQIRVDQSTVGKWPDGRLRRVASGLRNPGIVHRSGACLGKALLSAGWASAVSHRPYFGPTVRTSANGGSHDTAPGHTFVFVQYRPASELARYESLSPTLLATGLHRTPLLDPPCVDSHGVDVCTNHVCYPDRK